MATSSRAVEPIVIGPDDEKIDITLLGEFYERRGDKLSVETAPNADGIAGRMTVSAKTPGTNPSWVVFALSNPTDKHVVRFLTAQRYDIVGSRVTKPTLMHRESRMLRRRSASGPNGTKITNTSIFIAFRSNPAQPSHSSWNSPLRRFQGFI